MNIKNGYNSTFCQLHLVAQVHVTPTWTLDGLVQHMHDNEKSEYYDHVVTLSESSSRLW